MTWPRFLRLRSMPRPDLALVLAIAAVMALAVGAVELAGLDDVAVYAALVGLYVAMGAFGGTLRADLSILAAVALALVAAVALPALLAPVAPWAAALVVLLMVGLTSLVTVLGQRYVPVEQGIGLITVYAYGYLHPGVVEPVPVVAATFLVLAVVVVIRVVGGLPDPDAPLRAALADVLSTGGRHAVEKAAVIWLRGPGKAWTADVLVGGLRVDSAVRALRHRSERLSPDSGSVRARALEATLQQVTEQARDLAGLVRAKRPPAVASSGRDAPCAVETLHPLDRPLGVIAADALTRIEAAGRHRDPAPVPDATALQRAYVRTTLRGTLSWSSPRLRHAVRLVSALSIGFVLTAVAVPPAFALPLLMGTYGVLQPTWADSVGQARRRVVGLVAGAAVASLVVLLLPPAATVAIGLAALLIGFAYVSSSITVFMGCLVVALTVTIAPLVHVTPERYAVGYAIAAAGGALLATVFAFTWVRGPSAETQRRALRRAGTATAHLAQLLAEPHSSTDERMALLALAHP